MKIFDTIPYYTGTEAFLKEATKIIYQNKSKFDEYIRTNQKLTAVKFLKESTSTEGGLKNCKDVCDAYWIGNLPNYVKEDRKLKLESLAKTPLVEQLMYKLKNIEEDKLHSLLMNLSVDELLSIDEFFIEEIFTEE